MDVDTRSLELLEALATDGTLTAAARRMHVSQPALSQRLTGLEARLGIQLFERQGRRLEPTRAGQRMLHATTAVLTELRAAGRDLEDLRSGRDGTVRFTTQCSTNYQWLPPIIHAYRDRCPGVEIRIVSVPGDEPIPALLADRVDVALVVKADRRSDGVVLHRLFDDEMVAVVPVSHAWAKRRFVDAADFDGVHLIVFDSYDQARIPALPLPLPPGSRPARVTSMPVVTELVIEMVAAGQGVGLLPSWVAGPYLSSHNLASISLTQRPDHRTWSCATRRGDQPAHITALVDLIRAHFTSPYAAP
jgi:LysR family transcriptional regulator for metE and metH